MLAEITLGPTVLETTMAQYEGTFPTTRMRRNRRADWTRRLVAENRLAPDDFIWPLFVTGGTGKHQPISSMPGVYRMSIDRIAATVAEAKGLGIPAVAVFPYTDDSLKTPDAAEALNPDNLVCRAVKVLKDAHPEVGIVCDVALDPYNSDGHDGLVQNGEILNDQTIEVLCQQAIVQAEAGCDVIAPSDMMDGRVRAIRRALDGSGFQRVQIMSYAA